MKKETTLQDRAKGNKQAGQGMSEYIIIVALIAIAAISVAAMFGGTVRSQIAGMAQELSGHSSSSMMTEAKSYADKANTSAQRNKNLSSYDNKQAKQ